jgi:hypothetical protein
LLEQVCSQAKQLLQGLVNGLLGLLILFSLPEAGDLEQHCHRLVDHAQDEIFGIHTPILPG